VAMAVGNLCWIDRPLQDYIQHGQNVTGFGERPRPPIFRMISNGLKALVKPEGRVLAKKIYFDNVPKIILTAQVISLRCGSLMSKPGLKSIHRITLSNQSFNSVLWFSFRSLF